MLSVLWSRRVTLLGLLGLLGVVTFGLSACGKNIGDQCRVNNDCYTEDNTRSCDISQPGGYCTVDGCDERSCPKEGTCIRFFPRMFLDQPCDPAAADSCPADQVCLPTEKLCAPRSGERRYCAFKCGDSGDCRGGYECKVAGATGTATLALTRNPASVIKFCAPHGR